jgi:hypothetical protein
MPFCLNWRRLDADKPIGRLPRPLANELEAAFYD